MHVNWKKTKLQNVGAGEPPPPVTIGSETVAAVDKFTYLGSDVSSSGSSSPEILRRIGMANTTMGQLDSIWKKKNLSLTTKLRLYSSLVVSVLLYGSETWTLLKENARKIQAFHMQCQRRILGVKWFDHVSNQTISQRTGLGNINNIIANRRHTLFGHVCRAQPRVSVQEAPLLSAKITDKTWSIYRWLATSSRQTKAALDPASCRGRWGLSPIVSLRRTRSVVVEVATTIAWSSAAVSE